MLTFVNYHTKELQVIIVDHIVGFSEMTGTTKLIEIQMTGGIRYVKQGDFVEFKSQVFIELYRIRS